MRVFFLSVGFIYILFVLFVCCMMIFFAIALSSDDVEKRSNKLKSLKKIPYSTFYFKEGRECAICLSVFQHDEQVIQLKCNRTHVYHLDCIEQWVLEGNLVCPLDGKEIDKNLK